MKTSAIFKTSKVHPAEAGQQDAKNPLSKTDSLKTDKHDDNYGSIPSRSKNGSRVNSTAGGEVRSDRDSTGNPYRNQSIEKSDYKPLSTSYVRSSSTYSSPILPGYNLGGSSLNITADAGTGLAPMKSVKSDIRIPGFSNATALYVGAKGGLIFRAVRDDDNKPVILKYTRCKNPNDIAVGMLKAEYSILKEVQSSSNTNGLIIKAYDMAVFGLGACLVLEDIGGMSLTEWVETKRSFVVNRKGFGPRLATGFFVSEVLEIVRDCAAALQLLHGCKIIHKDITPNNVIVAMDEITLVSQVIDLSVASHVSTQAEISTTLEGTLSFMSPEQTGRFNRRLDYRSDLYGLGATMYFLLTGDRPFQEFEIDELSIIHAHLARPLIPPAERDPKIPSIVSELVYKLMKKSPEERYQTAAGLKSDLDILLQECLKQSDKEVFDLSPFALGKYDGKCLFSLPESLFGRDNEIKLLQEAFRKTCQTSTPSLCLVTGYSGIGKTRFVNEIAQDVTAVRANYVTGKCDQIRNRPLSCFLQGFQSLIKRQLAATDEEIERLKTSVSTEVRHLSLLLQVMPELKAIVDASSISASSEALSDSSLFLQEAFVDLVAVLTEDRPLCMFIDDLQWGDYPTFQLMQSFVKSPKVKRFFLIGAYRVNELASNAFLKAAIEKLKSDVPELVREVALNNFDLINTQQYIKSCFNGSFEENALAAMSELIYIKSRGNPYHLGKLLERLYEDKMIYVSYQDTPEGNVKFLWHANIKAIENLADENILQLVIHDMKHLDSSTKSVLQFASAIGNVFSLTLLRQSLAQRNVKDILLSLNQAINAGIIRPLTAWSAKLRVDMDEVFLDNLIQTDNPQFRWTHDQVQQAVYESIESDNVAAVEWAIADAWCRSKLNDNDDVLAVFEAAEHFVRSMNNINFRNSVSDENVRLAGTSLMRAGFKAYSGGAMDSAIKYFGLAFDLIGEHGWVNESKLKESFLEAHFCAQRAAVYMKDHNFRVKIFNSIVLHVESPLLRARAHAIEADGLEMEFKPECVERCHQALELLGHHLPKASTCQRLVRRRDFFNIPTLPEEREEKSNLIAQCLGVMGVYFY
ncbi:hypothetical protein HDU76_004915, partial [Blyttiomyces sp. JEL0837]